MKKYILGLLFLVSTIATAQSPFPDGIRVAKGVQLYTSGTYANKLGFGTLTPASAYDFISTTGGLTIPRMTTTQRNATSGQPVSSLIWNTTNTRFEYFDGAVWQPLTAGAVPSWQDQYDADPNNTVLDDGAGNVLTVTTTIITSETASGNIVVITDGALVTADAAGNNTTVTASSTTMSNSDGWTAERKVTNLTENYIIQEPNLPLSTYTPVYSVEVNGVETFADTSGKVDLGTIGGGTIDPTPTDGSTNAVQSNGVFDALALKAPLASPALTGAPTAPTATAGTNNTQLATTAYADAKRTFSHRFQGSAQTWADGVTYYYAGSNNVTPLLSSSRYVAAGITATAMDFSITGYFPGTLGSSENITILIRNVTTGTNYNLTTTYQATSVSSNLAGTISFTCTQGDLLELHVIVPTMATNPTGVLFNTEVLIRN